jgi:hypothetical protein
MSSTTSTVSRWTMILQPLVVQVSLMWYAAAMDGSFGLRSLSHVSPYFFVGVLIYYPFQSHRPLTAL